MNIQQEVRILNTTVELITTYLNYAICSFPDDRKQIVTTVLPQDNTAKKYFFILLFEVVAGVNKELVSDKDNGDNLLDLLYKVSNAPKLEINSTYTTALRKSVEDFIEWVNHEFEYVIYSANLGRELKIKLTRKEALYLIANRHKHPITRSNALLNKLIKIYNLNGADLDLGSGIIALEDINTWLFDDFGGYHFTKLCELSVNVYHGIVEYLRPVFDKVIFIEDNIKYSYKIPDGITQEVSKSEFYALLNAIRSPFLPKIETCESIVRKY